MSEKSVEMNYAELDDALPYEPSALIRLALADLEKVEKLSNLYCIDMGVFHLVDYDLSTGKKICNVCFAGAVMAGTLGVLPTKTVHPADFTTSISEKLQALDRFRNGHVADGVLYMRSLGDVPFAEDLPLQVDVTPYSVDPDRFKHDMVSMAANLESLGL